MNIEQDRAQGNCHWGGFPQTHMVSLLPGQKGWGILALISILCVCHAACTEPMAEAIVLVELCGGFFTLIEWHELRGEIPCDLHVC